MKDKYKKENLEKVVQKSKSIREVCRNLEMSETGRNFYTVKKYIEMHSIETNFLSREEQLQKLKFRNTTPLSEVLIKNSTYTSNNGIKKKILQNKLIEYKCKKCNLIGKWKGKELSLQLDHINGVRNDNRIKNLRFLCPNCHSQTETYCGKHTSNKAKKARERNENGGKTNKEKENYKNKRKVDRPSLKQLLQEVKELGYRGTGRKYEVSDNAVRKWIKGYKKDIE